MTTNDYTPVSLSPDQQKLCRNTLAFLGKLGADVNKVSKCGVDCSGYEALRNKLIEVNQAVHENFCGNPQLPV